MLAEKNNIIENDNINLTVKIQSMSKNALKLSKSIHTVEFDNYILPKSYKLWADRVSHQEGTMHAIQIIFKDEKLSLMKNFISWNHMYWMKTTSYVSQWNY